MSSFANVVIAAWLVLSVTACAKTTDDKELRTTATYLDRGLIGDLINYGVKFDVKPREEPSFLLSILGLRRDDQ